MRTIERGVVFAAWACCGLAAPARAGGAAAATRGREIFLREWVPGVPGPLGGDGLGPVYNDTSCVACHNLGGIGGAGAGSQKKNNPKTPPPNPGVGGGGTG